ncbi:DUF2391 family protein [Candidatus Woesearchaeota archaeon]|nr:DUF2391 family protein [Candidatus Woesearchaeota archaeon]
MKKRVSLEDVSRKLDAILAVQKKLAVRERSLEKKEHELEVEEKEELFGLSELKKMEQEIESELGPHPLVKVTLRDVAKGMVGAFIGVVAHFTFFYGIEVAEWLSFTRASLLYPLSFAIGGIFMYATGFRKVRDARVLRFLPVRLIMLYVVALLMAALVLLFFSPEFGHDWFTSYKQLATVTLIAVIGACTADLIGKE